MQDTERELLIRLYRGRHAEPSKIAKSIGIQPEEYKEIIERWDEDRWLQDGELTCKGRLNAEKSRRINKNKKNYKVKRRPFNPSGKSWRKLILGNEVWFWKYGRGSVIAKRERDGWTRTEHSNVIKGMSSQDAEYNMNNQCYGVTPGDVARWLQGEEPRSIYEQIGVTKRDNYYHNYGYHA